MMLHQCFFFLMLTFIKTKTVQKIYTDKETEKKNKASYKALDHQTTQQTKDRE